MKEQTSDNSRRETLLLRASARRGEGGSGRPDSGLRLWRLGSGVKATRASRRLVRSLTPTSSYTSNSDIQELRVGANSGRRLASRRKRCRRTQIVGCGATPIADLCIFRLHLGHLGRRLNWRISSSKVRGSVSFRLANKFRKKFGLLGKGRQGEGEVAFSPRLPETNK